MTGTAVASTAVAGLLAGRPRPARVLSAFRTGAYVAVDETVLGLLGPGAVRLPNALVLTRDLRVAAGDAVTIGDGQVLLGGSTLRVARWWDPRPRLPLCPEDRLRSSLRALDRAAPALPRHPPALAHGLDALTGAVRAADPERAAAVAGDLIGAGPGLTPAGDDVLAGCLATLTLVAHGDARLEAVTRAIGDQVTRLAPARTPALSAALLRHALHGEVCAPMAGLLQAVCGAGAVAHATAALAGVGHTSGRDLLAGVRLALAAVLERKDRQ